MRNDGRGDLGKAKRNGLPANWKKLVVESIWFFKELSAIFTLTKT